MTPRLLPLVLFASLAGCGLLGAPGISAQPHYVLESAWRSSGGVWFYPRQSFSYDETGLAAVYGSTHPPLTTDGEAYDPQAMAAASQTLQLPAIARVTNLENGRQVVVRVNDRGPASPARLIALTPRAGALLGILQDGTAQVRVQVESGPSQALAQELAGATARLAIARAPVRAVEEETLAPPPGIRSAPGAAASVSGSLPSAPALDTPLPPLRLPATVTEGAPAPGRLFIRANSFSTRAYAEQERRALAAIDAVVVPRGVGRGRTYRVRAGPFPDVAAADAALAMARTRVADARIVVE